LVLNWHKERQLSGAEQAVRRERVMQQVEILVLTVVTFLSSILLAWSGMTLSVGYNAVFSSVVALVVLASFSVTLNPIIAKVNAFSFFQTVLSIPLTGANFYFFEDNDAQFPEGPHFTMFFYTSVRPFFGALFAMLGIFIYYRSAGSWTYQRMFRVGSLLQAGSRLFDVAFYLRLNKSLGVPDTFFFLGSASLESMLSQWMWMPCAAIYSQLAPRGLEAIMYANMAGCQSLGYTVANNLGAVLLDRLDVRPAGRSSDAHQFDNLWVASLVTSILPLIPVLATPYFIPNKYNTERILDRENMPANEGSLYQRWRGWRRAARTDSLTLISEGRQATV